MNNLTYSQSGDYLIPDLTVTEPAQPIGKYGRMRKQYLMEHRTPLFHSLLLSEKLFPHLLEIDQTATRRMEQIMADLAQPYVQGLTLLGGEPFLNTGILLPLVKRIRKELPDKDIWSWTGYTWEEMLQETPDKLELLSLIDILVDGRFDLSKKNVMLQFRGSSNQRIIDVQKSLASGQVVIWDKLNDGDHAYEQVSREKKK